MARTADDFASACLAGTPGAILSDPGTREILEEFYSTIGATVVALEDPIEAAAAVILDPELCPEVALDGLLSLVGFSSGVGWIAGLVATTKRKLASVAPAIWRTKGQPDCLRSMYQMLAFGQDVVTWDFPGFAFEVGDDGPAFGWPDSPPGAFIADLFLADPRGDVDRDLMMQALATIKPGADTWTAVWCLIAEPFLQGLSRWTVTGTPTWTSGEVTLGADDVLSTPQTDLAIQRVLASLQIGSGASVEIRIGDPDTVQYVVTLGNGAGTIETVVAGVPSLLTTASPAPTIAPGVDYLIDARIWTTVAGIEIEVWLDGNRIMAAAM